jgi:hypothetical protein
MRDPRTSFDYVIAVPEGAHAALPWRATSRRSAGQHSIVGDAPIVDFEDVELGPGVLQTRVRFSAESDDVSPVRDISFMVDRKLATMLRAGDVVHVASGLSGGLGISILRSGELIAAAGTASAVPLGHEIRIGPCDVLWQAENFLQRVDPTYEMHEQPVQVKVGGETRLMHRGRPIMRPFEVFVVHGFVEGEECVAVTRLGSCPDCAATLSAPLLDRGFEIRLFVTPREQRYEEARQALEESRRLLAAGDLDGALVHALEAVDKCRADDAEAAQAQWDLVQGAIDSAENG